MNSSTHRILQLSNMKVNALNTANICKDLALNWTMGWDKDLSKSDDVPEAQTEVLLLLAMISKKRKRSDLSTNFPLPYVMYLKSSLKFEMIQKL